MKKPNPIFLGVIALAALLPHTPRLLPDGPVRPVSELQPTVEVEMPTAELPGATGEGSGCTGHEAGGQYENEAGHSEPGETPPDTPAAGSGQNCDSHWNPAQQNLFSTYLASARAQ